MQRGLKRGWQDAEERSLTEQHALMSSVVSLWALNPLLLPAVLLAWLLTLMSWLSRYTVVRTSLYLAAVFWSQTVILSIRAVTPSCAVFLAYALLRAIMPDHVAAGMPMLHGWTGYVALAFCVVEVAFYVHTLRRARRLQARVAGPEFSVGRRWLAFRRVEESSHCIQPMSMPKSCVHWRKFRAVRNNTPTAAADPSHPLRQIREGSQHPLQFLSGWFYNLELRHIRHENLMTFFAENALGLHLSELTPDQRSELEEVVSWVSLKASQLSPMQLRERQTARLKGTAAAARGGKQSQPKQSPDSQQHPRSFTDAPPPLLTAAAFQSGRIQLIESSPASSTASTASSSSSHSPAPPLDLNGGDDEQRRADSTSPDEAECDADSDSSSPVAAAHGASCSSPCISQRRPQQSESGHGFDSHPSRSRSRSHRRRGHRRVASSHPSSCAPLLLSPPSTRRVSSDSFASSSDSDSDSDSECAELNDEEWAAHVAAGTLPSGHNPAHDPMHLNLAPVEFLHRPLAIYAGVYGLGCAAGVYLRYLGFSRYSSGALAYWYRRAVLTPSEISNHTARADPLVLIHGIGIGPFTYLHMLREMFQCKAEGLCRERSMYLLELPYISMQLSLSDCVPSPSDHVGIISAMLFTHEMSERRLYDPASPVHSAQAFLAKPSASLEEVQQSDRPIKCIIVGHSYGTFVASWLLKYRSDLVSSAVLIDPVCFMVHDPSLIYNFIYRTPFSLVTSIYHYFTSKELGIAHALLRHFWWQENELWREELERLGMSPGQLEASLIAERELCVSAMPYADLLHASVAEEADMDPTAAGEEGVPPPPSTRAGSDGSRASALPRPRASEVPLCPASSLGVRTLIFLAANDDITPCPTISQYLHESIALQEKKWGVGRAMMRVRTFPGVGHAEALFHNSMRREIVDAIQRQPSHMQIAKECALFDESRSTRGAMTPA